MESHTTKRAVSSILFTDKTYKSCFVKYSQDNYITGFNTPAQSNILVIKTNI